MLFTADPADVHYTSSAKFSDFQRGHEFKKKFDVLGNGHFNTDGEEWSMHRKLARTIFSHPQFNDLTTTRTLEKVKEGVIPVLDDACSRGQLVDLQDIFQRYSYDLIFQLVTGCDPKKLSADFPEVPFSKAMDDAMKAIAARMIIPRSLWSLQRWLRIGRDTTSTGMSWFLWAIHREPSILREIREEMKTVLPPNEANKRHRFTAEELSKMIYLHASLCETLRLYPPVPFQARIPKKPDTLPSSHRVHPHMTVMISTFAMGRMTSIWGKDSKELKPERRITEQGKIKHEPAHKFFTFGAGSRICLGKEMAFAQMKAAAATILHNYDIEFLETDRVRPVLSVILQMEHGLKATLKDRDGLDK
ncbi:hypothetical protein Ancab_034845 [Ancistrocladus abbreviatus]